MTHATGPYPVQVDRDRDGASFDLIDQAECLELLSTTTVGRVAFVGSAGMVLLPVNHRVLDGDVHFRTSATGSLAELAAYDGEVLFEVDYHASTSRGGWSVLIRGTSALVPEAAPTSSPEVGSPVPWAPNSSALLLRIRTHLITGRRAYRDRSAHG